MDQVRKLTTGERSLASSIYHDAIDLDVVEMRRQKWWPFHPRQVVMAPCGHIHFHPKGQLWREDFSTTDFVMQGLFIHELCHVWQSQQGLFLPLRRLPFARYSYTLKPGRQFGSYGIEQQAEIVARTYLMRAGYLCMMPDEAKAHEDLIAQISRRRNRGRT